MTAVHYLTRARLRDTASVRQLLAAMAPPAGQGRRGRSDASVDAGPDSHRLIWTLFADDPDASRDFLYRQDRRHTYFILSARPPVDHHNLFDMDPPKPFQPQLAAGDVLQFSLHANPVNRRNLSRTRVNGRGASVPVRVKDDVVMAALSQAAGSGESRADQRPDLVISAGQDWLQAQGTRCGFDLTGLTDELQVSGYQQHVRPRPGAAPMQYSTLDFDGLLRVTDPTPFQAMLTDGLGSARGFGCGLMLVRRPVAAWLSGLD